MSATLKPRHVDADGDIYAVCPKCNKQIYYLIYAQTGIQTYDVQPDQDEGMHYEANNFKPDNDTDAYYCPECNQEITNNEDKALDLFFEQVQVQDTPAQMQPAGTTQEVSA